MKARVWNNYNWIDLYDIHEAVPKRKPTPRQLEALEYGRQKRMKRNTCSVCREARCGVYASEISLRDGINGKVIDSFIREYPRKSRKHAANKSMKEVLDRLKSRCETRAIVVVSNAKDVVEATAP